MSRVTPLRHEDLEAQAGKLYEVITTTRAPVAELTGLNGPSGSLNGPFDLLLRTPVLGESFQQVGLDLRRESVLSDNVLETAILTCASELNAAFEWQAHKSTAIASGALTASDVDTIENRRPPTDGACRLAWQCAREMLESRRVSDDTYAAAAEAFSERGVVELTLLIGYYATLSLILSVFVEV